MVGLCCCGSLGQCKQLVMVSWIPGALNNPLIPYPTYSHIISSVPRRLAPYSLHMPAVFAEPMHADLPQLKQVRLSRSAHLGMVPCCVVQQFTGIRSLIFIGTHLSTHLSTPDDCHAQPLGPPGEAHAMGSATRGAQQACENSCHAPAARRWHHVQHHGGGCTGTSSTSGDAWGVTYDAAADLDDGSKPHHHLAPASPSPSPPPVPIVMHNTAVSSWTSLTNADAQLMMLVKQG